MKARILILLLIPTLALGQDLSFNWLENDATLKSAQYKSIQKQKGMASDVGSEYDLKFQRLLITVDPAIRHIQGSVSSYFEWTTNNHSQLTFDLHDSLQITAIRYHGELLDNYIHVNNILTITLPTQPHSSFIIWPKDIPMKSGRHSSFVIRHSSFIPPLDSIMIDYQGTPPEEGLGSFSLSRHGPDSIPVLYTLSEPYGAKDWWPCKQNLNDKIDSVLIQVTTPPQYSSASNGMLVGELVCEDKHVMQWKHNHPIAAYLIGIAVTNYAVYSDWVPLTNGDSIEILNYVYPETLEKTKSETPGLIESFQIFNDLFGLYPFADERYGHAEWNWGGGMEHQTMSFMGSFGHDLMAHELAHQWFGDFITCGSWRDIWLNEGFATYLTGLTYERMFNGIYWEPFKRLTIARVMREPGGSVYLYDTTDVNRMFDARLSYSKGAIVLHMLRWEMGDENFYRAMNNYMYDPAHTHGYATTEDFIRHVEAAADTSFREFFNDWIYGEGYPTYEVAYQQMTNDELRMSINQEQSDPSVDFFEMHLPIRVFGNCVIPAKAGTCSHQQKESSVVIPAKAGTCSHQVITTKDYILHNTRNNQTFTINPGFIVDSIQFDPDRWICTTNPIIAGVNDIPLEQEISIYPNPATEVLYIQLTTPIINYQLSIINLFGQHVMHLDLSQFPHESTRFTIPLHEVPSGVYIVAIGDVKKKIVIKK